MQNQYSLSSSLPNTTDSTTNFQKNHHDNNKIPTKNNYFDDIIATSKKIPSKQILSSIPLNIHRLNMFNNSIGPEGCQAFMASLTTGNYNSLEICHYYKSY